MKWQQIQGEVAEVRNISNLFIVCLCKNYPYLAGVESLPPSTYVTYIHLFLEINSHNSEKHFSLVPFADNYLLGTQ